MLVFAVLAAFYVDVGSKPRVATVISDLHVLQQPESFQDELTKDEDLQLDAPVSLTPSGGTGSIGTDAQGIVNPIESTVQVAAATSAIGNRSLVRPLTGAVGNLGLDSNIRGLKGISELATGGDIGVIDRVTQEILRQLSKNKVIVAWVLDSSLSLEERRQAIATRLDRIYKELDELGVNKDSALLSAVVSVGQGTRFLTEPTNNLETIRKAIRAVKDDRSGVENLFTAVRDTALKYRRYQTSGRRTLMIILLTDEIGDDEAMADDTVALLKRNGVPLYAMGPMATFGRPIIHDTWVDKEYKQFLFWIEVKRGPYTRREEILRVPFNATPYRSGFGPFALTQVTRETGGIFFIYDDTRVADSTKYDPEILMRYKANYGSAADYLKEITSSPFRRTLMEVVEDGNKMWNTDWPHGWVHAKNWRSELDDRQREIAKFISFATNAIPRLTSVEPLWSQETDPRWRACFDLSFARLLQAKVRSDEYNWSCADFKLNPLTLKDPKNNNAWSYALVDAIRVGLKPGEARNGKAEKANSKTNAASSKLAEAAKRDLEKALTLYQRVIDQHPGTPWATAAQNEKNRNVGVDWREGYDRNYTVDPEERKRYETAAKRVPKK